jgi:plastocyanin
MKLTTKVAAVAAAALLGLSSLGGCGSTSDTPKSAPSSNPTSSAPSSAPSNSSMASMIMIKNFKFTSPASIKAGSKVMVMNQDAEAHTVTSDTGKFDVKVDPGKSVTLRAPSKPGVYPFHCMFHSQMHGSLKVR